MNAETLIQIAKYPAIFPDVPATSISFHPFDHMFSCCAIGDSVPIFLYTKDELFEELEKDAQSSALITTAVSKTATLDGLTETLQHIQSMIALQSPLLATSKPSEIGRLS